MLIAVSIGHSARSGEQETSLALDRRAVEKLVALTVDAKANGRIRERAVSR